MFEGVRGSRLDAGTVTVFGRAVDRFGDLALQRINGHLDIGKVLVMVVVYV